MPWFRRKRDNEAARPDGERASAAAPAPTGPEGTPTAPVPSDVGPRSRLASREWTNLPPLTPTVSTQAPKVGGADQFVASLPGTQQLVHPPVLPGSSDAAPRGLVHGLTAPLAIDLTPPERFEVEPVAAGSAVEARLPPPPVRRLPAHGATPPDTDFTLMPEAAALDIDRQARPAVTAPVSSSVPPPRPPAPTPAVDEPAREPFQPQPPLSTTAPTTSPGVTGPSAEVPSVFDVDAAGGSEMVLGPRRLNLGQSRRAGLGPPIEHDDEASEPVADRDRPLGVALGSPTDASTLRTPPPSRQPSPPTPPTPPSPPAPSALSWLGPALTSTPAPAGEPIAGALGPVDLVHAPPPAAPIEEDREPVRRAVPDVPFEPPPARPAEEGAGAAETTIAPAPPPSPPTGPPARPIIEREPAPHVRVVPVYGPPAGGQLVAAHRPADVARAVARELERRLPTADEPVPPSLRSELRRLHRVDVGDKPVRRGPDVSEQAKGMGARAYARGGEVFLPAEEGPLDAPTARGILAHELTHAAQQALLGPRLPQEDTPAGRLLEAHAEESEAWFRGEPGSAEPASLTELTQRHLPVVDRPLDELAELVAAELWQHAGGGNGGTWTAPFNLSGPLTPTAAPSPPAALAASGVQRKAVRPGQAWDMLTQQLRQGARVTMAPIGGLAQNLGIDVPFVSQADMEEAEALQHSDTQSKMRTELANRMREEFRKRGLPETASEAEEMGLVAPGGGSNLFGSRAGAAGGRFGSGTAAGAAEEEPETVDARDRLREMFSRGLEVSLGPSVGFLQNIGLATSYRSQADIEEEEAAKTAAEDDRRRNVADSRRRELTGAGDLSDPEREDRAAEVLEHMDLDELTERIYDRLRSRLRTELLVDRERAGLLADFR